MTTSAKVFLGITIALAAVISVIVIAGVIVLSSLGWYYFVSTREANELLVEGSRAVAAGEYDAAIAQYSLALRKPLSDQQKAYVYINRGYAYNAKGRFAEAIADQSAAIRLNPQLSYAFSARGYAYLQLDELEKSFDDLTESIRLEPNSDFAYYNRALLLVRRGDFAAALMDFDEAVRCSPARADRLIARGLCYVAMNDVDHALANFDGAIATEPSNAIGYFARAQLYARRGNSDKKQRDYQQALRLNPNAEKLWTEFDQWFADQARVDVPRNKHFDFDNVGLLAPIEHFSPQQMLGRNAGKTYHQLFQEAKVAHDQGDYDDEIALWSDVVAMDISPIQAAPAMMNRGTAYAAKGELYTALRDYDEAIRLDPKNSGAYVNRALSLGRIGELESAMNDYAKAITLNPQQWEAYFNRAAELRDSGKLCEAVDDLEKVMELHPGFAGAYMNRANIYVRQGELDKAIDDYKTALLRDPNLAEVYVARANVFIRKKNYQKAVGDLQAAVQMKTRRPERVLNSLAWLRATCPDAEIRNGKEAVKLAWRACELSEWKDWSIIDTLAAAYAEEDNFKQAIKYQKQVLQIRKSSNDNDRAKEHLALYEKHKPFREMAQ